MSDSEQYVESLEGLFEYELEGIYNMEVKLVDALDEMALATTNGNLESGFSTHRDETETQVERIEDAFAAYGVEPRQRDCPIVDALDKDRQQFERMVRDDDLKNLYYLGAAMKTERLEISSYQALLTTANKLDLDSEVTSLLEDNLDEEKKTLKKLEGLSEGSELKSLWDRLTGG
jgi:ferritin-like metal-binding protein YciE